MEGAVVDLIVNDYQHEFAIVMLTAVLTAIISSMLVEPIARAFMPGANGMARWKSVIFFVTNMMLLWLFYFGFKPVDDHNYAEWAFLTFLISALSSAFYANADLIKLKIGDIAIKTFTSKEEDEGET